MLVAMFYSPEKRNDAKEKNRALTARLSSVPIVGP
jgi:hypothetical protein